MPTITLKNSELAAEIVDSLPHFPKYTTQIMNLANQNAQGTRSKVVGQMTELLHAFGTGSYNDWKEWYANQQPASIEDATELVYTMVEKLRDAIALIDRAMVSMWVEDLVVTKTFVGLRFQEAILSRIAALEEKPYTRSNPQEESQGIDGYIGDQPVSIKPSSYVSKSMLPEHIVVTIVLYEKLKDGIRFSYEF
jgi:hypothetical protein